MLEADMYSAINKGVTHGKRGDYKQAVTAFTIALAQSPQTLKRFPLSQKQNRF